MTIHEEWSGLRFDVDMARAVAKAPGREVRRTDVLEWASDLTVYGPTNEAMQAADLSEPVILARFGPHTFLIDGWARVGRAYAEGVETLPAIVLWESESRAVSLDTERTIQRYLRRYSAAVPV